MRLAIRLTLIAVLAGAATASTPKRLIEGQATLYSVPALTTFGERLLGLPDVDRDGIDDFVLGAYDFHADEDPIPTTGDVEIRSGRDGHLVRTIARESTTVIANSLTDLGDLDRDGTHDFAIGTTSSALDRHRGRVTIVSGREGSVLRTLTGALALDEFGSAIAPFRDVDGDAVRELIVGAFAANGGRGRVTLHDGATGTITRTLDAPGGVRGFGAALALLGDIDGDRVPDFAVGAATPFTADPGFVFVYSGGDYSLLRTHQGSGTDFGIYVGDAGDFDRDGRGDYYLADPGFGGDARNGGPGLYELHSGATGEILLQRTGTAAGEQVGRSLGSFDYDGDGWPDITVGRYAGTVPDAGSFAILANPDGRELARYTNDVAPERLGKYLAPIGDIDGDGRVELALGTFGAPLARVDVVAGVVAATAPLRTPDATLTGLWYDPLHAGEGFVLEMLAGNRAVVYWFTYTTAGAQRYFVASGDVVGKRIVFDALYDTRGGRLGGAFAAGDVELADRARLVFTFDGCDSGYAEYTVDGWRARQRLRRLSAIPALACAQPAAGVDRSGSFYDAAHPGEGWIVQSTGVGQYVVFWFTYDANGAQQWFVVQGSSAGDTLQESDALRPIGGRFGPYFDPAEVERPARGRFSLAYDGCDAATVRWSGALGTGSARVVRLTTLDGLSCAP